MRTVIQQLLSQSFTKATDTLQQFLLNIHSIDQLQVAFGNNFDPNIAIGIATKVQAGDFSFLPSIEIRTVDELGGANGVYDNTNDRILVSSEFLAESIDRPNAIVNLLLEEIGHKFDRLLNGQVDSAGDEGAIFAAIVQGQILSADTLAQLRSEDDHRILTIDGQQVSVEMETWVGTSGDDYHVGSAGDDVLDGLAGNDTLDSGSGNDTLIGGEGDDYFRPGSGADSIDGGVGNDTLSIYNRTDTTNTTIVYTDVINGGTITGGFNNGTTFKNIEYLQLTTGSGNDIINITAATGTTYTNVYSGAGNDTIVGSATASYNLLNGEEGNDSITGGAGSDTLLGGAGNDTLLGGAGDDYLNPGTGADIIDGGAGYDNIYINVSDTANVTLVYTNANTGGTITGGFNNGSTIKNIEQIVYISGSGNDSINVSAVTGFGTNINGGAGNDTIVGSATGSSEQLYGGDGNDSIVGGTGNNYLYGQAGNDTLTGGAGSDTLNGGTGDDTYIINANTDTGTDNISEYANSGIDTLSFQPSTTAITINLSQTANQTIATGVFVNGNLDNIENVIGGAGNDNITGNALDNIFSSGAGNDTLNGGAGDDSFDPGRGADSIDGGAGYDRLSIDNSTDTADTSISYTNTTTTTGTISGGSNHGTTFKNIEQLNLTTGAGNDSFFLDTGSNIINGGAGNDTLYIGNTSDTADVTIVYTDAINGGTITGGSNNGTTFKNIEAFRFFNGSGNDSINITAATKDYYVSVYGGYGNDTIIGSATASYDILSGGNGNDSILGGAGNNTLYGGVGDDILNGGSGSDVLDPGTGADNIDGGVGSDSLTIYNSTDTANTTLVYSNATDGTIIGGSNDGTTFKSIEHINLTTGSGNDSINIGATGELGAYINAGAGDDTIIGSATGSYDNLYGGDGNDSIIDGAGNNYLYGNAGDDIIDGGLGNDTVNGGAGNDIIDGGNGTDTAVYEGKVNTYTIERVDNLLGNSLIVTDIDAIANGNDDIDTLTSVENLSFFNGVNLATSNLIGVLSDRDSLIPNTVAENSVNGSIVGITALAVDGDSQTVTYSLVNDAGGRFKIDSSSGVVTVANGSLLDFESNRSHGIIVKATSVDGSFTKKAFTIDITNVNEAPTGTASAILTNGTEDTSYLIDLAKLLVGFSDVDGDPLFVANLSADRGSVLLDNGIYTFTPDANYNGVVNLTYNVIDGKGGSIAAASQFSLAAVNDAPFLSFTQAGLPTGTEDTSYTIDISRLLVGFSDVDGDILSVANLSANHGSILVNNGVYTFTPDANYNGVVNLTYNVVDGKGGSVAANSQFSLIPVNDVPILASTQATLVNGTEDTTYAIDIAKLLVGFSDVDGDTLSVTNLIADRGSIAINNLATPINSGFYAFTPVDNYNGIVNLSYNVIDSQGGSIAASSQFSLASVNDAPILSATQATLLNGTEDTSYTIDLAKLLVGFSDVDGDILSVANLTANHGSILVNNGIYTFTPDANYNGVVYFTYNVVDGKGGSVVATSQLSLAAVNDAPILSTAQATLVDGTEDTSYTIDVAKLLVGFSDVDGDTLSISNLNATNGSIAVNNGVYTFTPNANYNGIVNLSYNVVDGKSGTVAATSQFSLTAVNDAPILSAAPATLVNGIENTSYTIDIAKLLVGFSDVDGDVLSVTNLTANHGSILVNNGVYTFTPDANYNGTVNLAYNVVDGKGGSATATSQFSLIALPTISIGNATVVEGLDNSAVVTVNLSKSWNQAISVNYTTGGGTANSSLDYSSINGTLSFAAGETSKTIVVPILNDNLNELDETLNIILSNPINSKIATAQGVVTITDTLQKSISTNLSIDAPLVENLTLIGTSNINGTGNAGNNIITGNSGNNIIEGGAGNDTMNGGAGDDTYVFNIDVALGSDSITETINAGSDTILFNGNTAVNINLATTTNQIVNANLVLKIVEVENITGGGGADTILGNNLANILSGGGGNDILNGGAGNDILVGGTGNDLFGFGGTGLTSTAAIGIDKIQDFAVAQDKIQLSKSTFTLLSGNSLTNSTFKKVTTDALAETSSAAIVYNTTNGKLFYNTNGATAGFGTNGGQFAELSASPNLGNTDFTLIS
jgi:Ca2+-binding RTX toxin-like protein